MGLKPGEDEPVGLEGQQSSGDLDFQELGESKNLGYSDQRRRIVYSVLGFDAMDRQLPCNDDSLLEGVVTALGRRVADLSGSGTTALSPFMVGLPKLNQSAATSEDDGNSSSGSSSSISGRLGPAVVNVDRVSAFGQLSYSPNGLILESLSNFSSVRASACVYSGKWQYEVVLHTAGIQQIGWATVYCPFTTEEGVGDAPDSYAYDGKRIRKWNVKCQPYGQPWAPGDVIGALVDLDAGEVSFMRNGESMGVAYPTIRTMQPHLAYFPALSLSYTEKAEVNFGGRPFLYPAPKHLPLQLAPTGGRLELGAYLSQCVKRLALASQSVVGTSSAGNLSRPCDLSAHSDDPPGLEEDKDELQTLPPQGQGLFQSIPDGPRAGKASKVLGADQQQLEWEDAWLLGSAIGDQIGAMLQVPPTYTVSSPLPRGGHATAVEYFVHGQLLPALISLHGARAPHDVASTCAAARLLQMGLETATFEAVGGCLLEALASRCVSAALDPEEFPHSASYPFISLTCCLVRRLPAFKSLWLRHSNFDTITEWLMSRKPLGPEDIKGLLPAVWWRGCRDETAAEERMKYALVAFESAVVKVEDVQYELLTSLIGEADARAPSQDAMISFFRRLVLRNRGANRDMLPPGLSDPNVLVSVWFILLRLLWGALGDLKQFPVTENILRVATRSDLEPLSDLPRLGGLLSFLQRESPTTKAEAVPISMADVPSSLQRPPCRDPVLDSLKPEWVVELLSMSMALYSLRVVTSVRQIQTMLLALSSSIASLEEVERHMVRGRGAGQGSSSGMNMSHMSGVPPPAVSTASPSAVNTSSPPSSDDPSSSAGAAATATATEVSASTIQIPASTTTQVPASASLSASALATTSALADASASTSASTSVTATAAPAASTTTTTPAPSATTPATTSTAPATTATTLATTATAPATNATTLATTATAPATTATAPATTATTPAITPATTTITPATTATTPATTATTPAGNSSWAEGSALDIQIANVLASALSEQETADLDSMGGAQGAGTTPSFSRLHVHNPLHFASSFGGATPTPSTPSPAMPTPSGGEPSSGVSASTGSTASASASAAAAAAGSGASGSAALQQNQWQETRTFLRLDIASNGRCGLLLETTFYSGWKMDALMYQAGWVSHMLLQASTRGSVLSYIPNCFVEMVVDSITALRRSIDSVFNNPQKLKAQGLDDIISFLVSALNDGRICTPDIKESLLACLSLLLESSDFLPLFEQNEMACSKLVPNAISMFDSRLWHPVSAVLLRLTHGSGFGNSAKEQGGRSVRLRDALKDQLRPGGHPEFAAFLNRLFNTLNWAVTGFAVSISDLHKHRLAASSRGSSISRRHASDEQQQQRKAAVMFDLTVGLLRLLEYTALNSPKEFLEPGAIELTRLMEVIPFVLGHFTVGADARRLTELLNHQQQNPPQRLERNILAEKISRASVLAPVMGLLLGLDSADQKLRRQMSGGGEGAGRLSGSGDLRPSFVETLADILDPRIGSQQLTFMQDGVAWASFLPSAAPPSTPALQPNGGGASSQTNQNGYTHKALSASLTEFRELCDKVELVKKVTMSPKPSPGADHADSSATGTPASAMANTGPDAGPDEDIPEEFVDPLTCCVMRDPVILPDSQVTVDRSTIARHLLTQAADPFSRKDLTIDMVTSDDELRQRIRAWQRERRAQR